MGGGILSKLLSKADDAIMSGLSRHPNSIGIGRETLKQRAKQRLGNIDDAFANQDLSYLLGRNNLKIRDTGGGGTPVLQEIYSKFRKK